MKHYSKFHSWIDDSGDVGLTQYALDQLGEIVYVELETYVRVSSGDEIGNVESVKACDAILAPVGGEYVAHKEWLDSSGDITEDTVLFTVAGGLYDSPGLMSEKEYKAYCEML